jgi:hypothetical protein
MSEECQIIEVDTTPDNCEQSDAPKTKRTRKPLSGAAREKALENLAKAREARKQKLKDHSSYMKSKQDEYKRSMMAEREYQAIQRGDKGYGKYADDSGSDSDYSYDDDVYTGDDDDVPQKIYKTGRRKKVPIVSGKNLDEDFDDSKPRRSRKPTIQDQKIDYLERKLNELVTHVKKKTKPSRKVTKNTVIIPPQVNVTPSAQKAPLMTQETKKALRSVLNLF